MLRDTSVIFCFINRIVITMVSSIVMIMQRSTYLAGMDVKANNYPRNMIMYLTNALGSS